MEELLAEDPGPAPEYPLEEAIAVLPESYRQVILLRYYEGLSCQEVATRLGMPLGTVTKTLSRAYALLHLNTIPERFGLVLAEANAAGVPVIAMDLGSCREVVADGVTGFLAANVPEAARCLDRIPQIDRGACRQRVEQRFSMAAMAAEYERVYLAVLEKEERKMA